MSCMAVLSRRGANVVIPFELHTESNVVRSVTIHGQSLLADLRIRQHRPSAHQLQISSRCKPATKNAFAEGR